MTHKDFQVAGWTIQPSRLKFVSPDDREAVVEPKVMAVLLCLADHAGDVVTRDTLMRTVWPDVIVVDSTLTRCVSELRKALGDHATTPEVVETIRSRGYRLMAPVRQTPVADRVAIPPKMAYRTVGGRRVVSATVVIVSLVAAVLFLSIVSRSTETVQNVDAPIAHETPANDANAFVLVGEPITQLEAVLAFSESDSTWTEEPPSTPR